MFQFVQGFGYDTLVNMASYFCCTLILWFFGELLSRVCGKIREISHEESEMVFKEHNQKKSKKKNKKNKKKHKNKKSN